MDRVNTQPLHTILDETDLPVAEVLNPHGTAEICIVCEHASAFVPKPLNHLGVHPDNRQSHAAWDIGGLTLARALSERLNAPLVASRISRLVYDCNRPPSAPDAIPARSEVIDVPGNIGLSPQNRNARITEIYEPFRQLLSETLDGFSSPPALITIHTFTPIWHGQKRAVELGLLHDSDATLANAMLAQAPPGLNTQLNAPYSVTDGVTHTLREHAIPRGLHNVMIEVRNDLVSDSDGVARMADILSDMSRKSLSRQGVT